MVKLVPALLLKAAGTLERGVENVVFSPEFIVDDSMFTESPSWFVRLPLPETVEEADEEVAPETDKKELDAAAAGVTLHAVPRVDDAVDADLE